MLVRRISPAPRLSARAAHSTASQPTARRPPCVKTSQPAPSAPRLRASIATTMHWLPKTLAPVLNRVQPAADGEWNEDLVGHAPHEVCDDGALVRRRGDVEEGQLVRALGVVALALLDGVARVHERDETYAFDDATVVDIKTRDDAFSQHEIELGRLSAFREILQQAESRRLTLLRVELHAADVCARDDRGVGQPVLGLADDNVIARLVAKVRVNEIEERAGLDAFAECVPPPPRDLIPTDLRHAQPFWKASHPTSQETEAARHAELFRLVEEHLHPDADPE